MKIRSIAHIDLSKPTPTRNVPSINRPWKEELIYFLMVDRFHDGKIRTPITYSHANTIPKEQLMKRFGGTFNGIKSQLQYIKNLGCTCIWLSPIFENHEKTYHGYAIVNFLETDPRYGTLEELKSLINEAHKLDIRIVLDIIVNHTADTWSYKEKDTEYNGEPYSFGKWNDATFPLPHEFRNVAYYKKMGAIQNWDSYPETQEGDIFELKKLVLDESAIGKDVLTSLITIYSYWMKELNIDGFRIDTVKHLSPIVVSNFCKAIRAYANYLGKENFLLVGEVIGDYKRIQTYIKPIKTNEGFQRGLDAVFDFPLHFLLEDIIKGKRPVADLYKTYKKRQQVCLKANKSASDFIVFADNHDQVAQSVKARIGFEATIEQVIASVGFLYFIGGIPCLYYGTEQFLQGHGEHDCFLREPMFHPKSIESYHFEDSLMYRNLALLAVIRKRLMPYVWADIEEDELSIGNEGFMVCSEQSEVVYLSKRNVLDKLILLFNPSDCKKTSVKVKFKETNTDNDRKYEYVYGGEGSIESDCGKLTIDLIPYQFVILEQT